ncbi:hypothetical protein BN2910_58130 [Achromobacter xylosoxidans]|nr:hypothetical protein BN2910_58130 [Achromobacter xylosoxidans]
MSASNMPQNGPAATLQISSTVMPANAEPGVMDDLSLYESGAQHSTGQNTR